MGSFNDKVRELVDLLDIEKEAGTAFGAMICDGVNDGSLVGISQDHLGETVKKSIESYIARTVTVFEEHFTEEQVDELLVLFGSATGMMFIAKQREMDRKLGDISLKEGEAFIKALTE